MMRVSTRGHTFEFEAFRWFYGKCNSTIKLPLTLCRPASDVLTRCQNRNLLHSIVSWWLLVSGMPARHLDERPLLLSLDEFGWECA